jgi:VanZ family protein
VSLPSAVRWRAWLPVALWGVIVAIANSIPNPPSLPTSILPLDKLVHFGEYFALGFLLLRAVTLMRWQRALLCTLIVGISVGIADELHQAYIPTRIPDPADATADGIGVLCGALGFLPLRRRGTTKETRP